MNKGKVDKAQGDFHFFYSTLRHGHASFLGGMLAVLDEHSAR
jgi:hypothetical protein